MQTVEDVISPVLILQNLIRFDTTNPPGNERICIEYVSDLLKSVGLDCTIYAKDENRPNLVCRLEGRGEASPLLLYGHADVVTTSGQNWTHPPFDAEVVDGYIWGRGALDMKGGLAMMIHAMMRMKREALKPAGDITLLVLSDEENSGKFGAEYMVKEHPEVFEGVKYALGEFGGFNIGIAGKKFYPIQVAEKQVCQLKITITGPGGHGSGIVPGNAMGKLGVVINRLEMKKLPVHVTETVKIMIDEISQELGFPMNNAVKMLLKPKLTDLLLRQLGEIGLAFFPMFHNTINPTVVRGGDKINVIPSEIEIKLDGRLLPGFSPEHMLDEVNTLLTGIDGVDVELILFEPCPATVDMGLFSHLEGVLKQMDPDGIPIPLLLTAVTDARWLSQLGIQSYGFVPMQVPEDFEFFKLTHAADERIPVKALDFGAEGIFQAISTYRGK